MSENTPEATQADLKANVELLEYALYSGPLTDDDHYHLEEIADAMYWSERKTSRVAIELATWSHEVWVTPRADLEAGSDFRLYIDRAPEQQLDHDHRVVIGAIRSSWEKTARSIAAKTGLSEARIRRICRSNDRIRGHGPRTYRLSNKNQE